MKKIFAALLAVLVMATLFAGCNLVGTDDGNVVIATVNGTPILKEEFNELYNYYYFMLTNYYGYDAASANSCLDSMKAGFVNDLIQQEVIRQQAEKAGYFNFSDEARTTAQEAVDENRKSYIDNLVEQYTAAFKDQEVRGKNEDESDEDYFKRIAADKYEEYLKENGLSEAEMLQEELENNAVNKYKEDMLKDVTVPESDIVTAYDNMVNEQKEAIGTSASTFVSSWQKGTYDPLVYYLGGYSLVQHILIPYDADDTTTYANDLTKLMQTITACDDEIESLEADLAAASEDTKAEIQADLDKQKADRETAQKSYDELLAKATAAIQTKTDEVVASLKDADEAKFIEVMLKETSDTGMKTEDAAKKGYLVGPEDGMVKEFSTAALALEPGQISEPVASCYGYHIIRCIKKLTEGKVPYDEVKDHVQEHLTEEKKDTEWTKMLEKWQKEMKIKNYTSRY